MSLTDDEQANVSRKLKTAKDNFQQLKEKNQRIIDDRWRSEEIEERRKWYLNQLDSLKAERQTKNKRTGQASTDLDDLISDAAEMVGQDIKTYDSWQSAMQALLGLLLGAVSTYNNRVNELCLKIMMIADPVAITGSKGAAIDLKNKLKNKIFGKPPGEPVKFVYNADMKNGKLETRVDNDVSKRLKGIKLDTETSQQLHQAQNQATFAFDLAVNAWLKSIGYQPDPTVDGKYVDEDGNQLTDALFATLKEDPNTGLDRFIHESADLDIRPGSRVRP